MWLSGLSTGLRTKGSLVQFPVRAHAWVAGQATSRGRRRGNHIWVFLSLAFSLPSTPSLPAVFCPNTTQLRAGCSGSGAGTRLLLAFNYAETRTLQNREGGGDPTLSESFSRETPSRFRRWHSECDLWYNRVINMTFAKFLITKKSEEGANILRDKQHKPTSARGKVRHEIFTKVGGNDV